MKILAHRGFWLSEEEKNSRIAFQRALDHGFGIETDVRDYVGEIVISHDMAKGRMQTYVEFLDQIKGHSVPIAVNIKADGLSASLSETHQEYSEVDAVFFDMSGPEHLMYRKRHLQTLNRVSEFESGYVFDAPDYGIWLDAFFDDLWRIDWLKSYQGSRPIFLVSPELHRREPSSFWDELRTLDNPGEMFLCTDLPLEARDFFGD